MSDTKAVPHLHMVAAAAELAARAIEAGQPGNAWHALQLAQEQLAAAGETVAPTAALREFCTHDGDFVCAGCGKPADKRATEPAAAREPGAEPTPADKLRAAARLVETFGRPLYFDGVEVHPNYGSPTRGDFDSLRALAEKYGATPVDECAVYGDETHARAVFEIVVDGVPLRVAMQVGGKVSPDLVDDVRTWVAGYAPAEVAS